MLANLDDEWQYIITRLEVEFFDDNVIVTAFGRLPNNIKETQITTIVGTSAFAAVAQVCIELEQRFNVDRFDRNGVTFTIKNSPRHCDERRSNETENPASLDE